jgi:hypothetical protein
MAITATAPPRVNAESTGFRLVVHAGNPASALSRAEVAQYYLGSRREGEALIAVDQSTKSPVRAAFSQGVLHLSVEAVQAHWMKAIVAGRVPPFTATEEDVLKMVAKEKRMIGYVSADTPLPPDVKVVTLRD